MIYLEKASFKDFKNICITSNSIIRDNGRLVMGAGVAKYFRDSVYNIDKIAGDSVILNGNIFQKILTRNDINYYLFPTKNNWKDNSDINLIKYSAKQLNEYIFENKIIDNFILPMPGCRNGGLNKNIVLKELENIINTDVVYVVDYISELMY